MFFGKIVKPKIIPKLDFEKNVPEEYSTFVVIPAILDSKKKVKELMEKLEVYFIANNQDNIYFALLGDCTSGENKEEKFDKEVEEAGIEEVKRLNKKYGINDSKIPKFNFFYRKRFWNGSEECFLGWERKRGLLNQFNSYILGEEKNVFRVNTLEDWKKSVLNESNISIPKIKYVITLDSDTNLILNSAGMLIGSMAHILNKPILNENKDMVIKGHAIIQPRIGINLEDERKNLFTKIYAGCRWNRSICKCNFRCISR